MNNKLAMGLIVGALFAVAIGLLTVEEKYYFVCFTQPKREISETLYLDLRADERLMEKQYNQMFIALGFFGGLGLGYLLGGLLSSRDEQPKSHNTNAPFTST